MKLFLKCLMLVLISVCFVTSALSKRVLHFKDSDFNPSNLTSYFQCDIKNEKSDTQVRIHTHRVNAAGFCHRGEDAGPDAYRNGHIQTTVGVVNSHSFVVRRTLRANPEMGMTPDSLNVDCWASRQPERKVYEEGRRFCAPAPR